MSIFPAQCRPADAAAAAARVRMRGAPSSVAHGQRTYGPLAPCIDRIFLHLAQLAQLAILKSLQEAVVERTHLLARVHIGSCGRNNRCRVRMARSRKLKRPEDDTGGERGNAQN